jgi:hypothetical protein
MITVTTKHKRRQKKTPDPKLKESLDKLAANYKQLFAESKQAEEHFNNAEKEVTEAQNKSLGFGRQSALDRWRAGEVIAKVEKALSTMSHPGGFKSWCTAHAIAYSTARQARDLYERLTEKEVRGLNITEGLKKSGQIKDRVKEKAAKAKAAKGELAKAQADKQTKEEGDKVLGSSNGDRQHIAAGPPGAENPAEATRPLVLGPPNHGTVDPAAAGIPPVTESVPRDLEEAYDFLKAVSVVATDYTLTEPEHVVAQVDRCIRVLEQIRTAAQEQIDEANVMTLRIPMVH